MQTISGYPTKNDVVKPSAVVRRNGAPVPATEVSVTRELASDLPEQVTTASGIVGATGSVRWGATQAVQTRAAHPWADDGQVPKPMEPVEIDMAMNGAVVPQLRGYVKRSGGSVKDGKITSQVVDPINKLNTPVTFPAHMIVMPPWEENGPFLATNNTPTFTTDRVLRACGFYATPKAEAGAILSAPLMGSTWPEIGRLESSGMQGFPSFPPSFTPTHWGVGPNSINASWSTTTSTKGTNKLDTTFWVSVKVAKFTSAAGNTDISVYWGTKRILLRITTTRQIQGIGDSETGAGFTVASLSAAAAASADTFVLRVTPAGVYTIYASNGASATGTLALPSALTTTNITSVLMTSTHQTAGVAGGLQVGFFTYDTHLQPTTAVLTAPAFAAGLDVMRRIEDRPGIDVLKEQAAAECASWWIDEQGVLQWRNRTVLRGADPVATLTAKNSLLDLVWESNDAGVRSKVVVASDVAKITRFGASSVTLHTGSGESLQSNQETTDVIGPGADEEWFLVHWGSWTMPEINRGEKTIIGGTVSKDGVRDAWAAAEGKLIATVTYISPEAETFSMTHTAGTLAAGETVILKTSEDDGGLRTFWRDRNLPIIRGKGRARWSKKLTTGASHGPADAAALEHAVGPWIQDTAALQALADDLSAQLSAPRATLSDVPVLPDFRRQLGDIVWLEDPDNMRLRIKVLVTKYTNTVNNGTGKASQVISGRILETPIPAVTNAQLDAHAAEYTNSQFDTLWSGATNAQLDSAPLSRG